jgi:hypothetical protein
MNELKQHIREEWTPKPGKQLLKSFLGFVILIITVVLVVSVHWIAGLGFFIICFFLSVLADRPRRIE